jgi:carbon-monoxide dehydrogenase medium subunit
MRAVAFDHVAPRTLSEACELLAEDGAMALAGGQSLMQSAVLREVRPRLLVDLARLRELRGVHADGALRIGAAEPMADLERDPLVARHAPGLVRTLATVGSVAIRSRATLGGSAAWADPTSQLPAALLALDATFVLRGPGGERRVPAEGFAVGAHRAVLGPGELICAVELPLAAGAGFGLRMVRRTSITWPVAGCAAVSRAGALRLALFGAAPVPRLARGLREVPALLDPPDDARASAAYRRAVAPVLARRAAADAEAAG